MICAEKGFRSSAICYRLQLIPQKRAFYVFYVAYNIQYT